MVVSGIYRGRLMNANVGCQETVIVDERGRGKKKGRSEGRDGMVLGGWDGVGGAALFTLV